MNKRSFKFILIFILGVILSGCSDSDVIEEGDSPLKFKILSYKKASVIYDTSYMAFDTVIIPSKVIIKGDTCSIQGIQTGAFNKCSNLKSVVIPQSVKNIGEGAFSECINLSDINIPSDVKHIGNYAFYRCKSLKNIDIPEGVSAINTGTFQECTSLLSMKLPLNLGIIGKYAFYSCDNLTSIDIPLTVSSIEGFAFGKCPKLTDINISPQNTHFIYDDGVIYNNDKTHLVLAHNKKGRFLIPSTVEKILCGAFHDCQNLDTVIIPLSVYCIQPYSFTYCKNTNIIVDNSFYDLNMDASEFDQCKSVKYLKEPYGNPFSENREIKNDTTAMNNHYGESSTYEWNKEIPERRIYVNSLKEFLDAIQNDVSIIVDIDNEFLFDDESFSNLPNFDSERNDLEPGIYNDYGALILNGFENINIEGASENPEDTHFVEENVSAAVITLNNCRNIRLSNLKMGHKDEGLCQESVIDIYNSQDISVNNCKLYGCGVNGIYISHSENVSVTNTEIYQCSEHVIVTMDTSKNIVLDNCILRDCTYGFFIDTTSQYIEVKNSLLSKNVANMGGRGPLKFTNNEWRNKIKR